MRYYLAGIDVNESLWPPVTVPKAIEALQDAIGPFLKADVAKINNTGASIQRIDGVETAEEGGYSSIFIRSKKSSISSHRKRLIVTRLPSALSPAAALASSMRMWN